MRLKELRLTHNLMQKELANKLNISQQTISKYENGQRAPDLETVIRIADFFDVPIDYLLERKTTGYLEFKPPIDNYLLLDGLTDESKKELRRFKIILQRAQQSTLP